MRQSYLLLACLYATLGFAQTDCPLGDPPAITGAATFCPDQTFTYRPASPLPADPQCGPLTYTWTVQHLNANGTAPLPTVLSADGDSLVLQFPAAAPGIAIYQLGLQVANDSSSVAAVPYLLTENPPIEPAPELVYFCLGDSVLWQGQLWLPTPGEPLTVRLVTPGGCDSLVTGIAVPLLPIVAATDTLNCCGSDPDCPAEGLYETTVGQSYLGCDSIVRTEVIHYPRPQTDLDTLVLTATDTLSVGGTTYTNLDAGSYAIVLDSYLGCDSTVAFVIVDATTTATTAAASLSWHVSPNPTTGPLALHLDVPPAPGARLRIHDTTGRLRATRPLRPGPQRIDLSELPAGVYLLSYRSAGGRYHSSRLVHAGR